MTGLCKFYFRLLHAKAIAEKADDHFFFFIGVFTDFWNVNSRRIRQKTVVLIFWYLFHGIFLFENIFFLYYTEDFRVVTFRKLFILFTGILLKSRVRLHYTPHYLKVGCYFLV